MLYWGYIGIIESKMETTVICRVYRLIRRFIRFRVSPNWGYLLWAPIFKDDRILGSVLGFLFRETTT